MKHSLFVLGAALMLASSCKKDSDPAPGENPVSITSQQTLGGNDTDIPQSIVKTPDGGYVTAGHTSSTAGELVTANGSWDAVVVKYSANHTIQWKKVMGGTMFDYATSIITTPDGGYVFTGVTSSTNGDATGSGAHGGDDVWVVKLDANGNIQWQKAYGGFKSDIAKSIALTSDGSYAVVGATESTNGDMTVNKGSYDCFVMKISTTGTLQWMRTLGSSQLDQANGVACGADGSIMMTGTFRKVDGDVTNTNGGEDIWLVKLNAAGDMLWQKNYGSTNNDQGNAIVKVAGGYVVTGLVQDGGGDVTKYNGNGDIWTFAIDETGKILWRTTVGGSEFDVAYGIAVATDGSLFIAGMSNSSNGDMKINRGNSDLAVIKLSSTGQLLWARTQGSTGLDKGQAVIPFGSRGCVVAATVTADDMDVIGNKNPGNYQWWLPVLQ